MQGKSTGPGCLILLVIGSVGTVGMVASQGLNETTLFLIAFFALCALGVYARMKA
jgi:hypothetical protein